MCVDNRAAVANFTAGIGFALLALLLGYSLASWSARNPHYVELVRVPACPAHPDLREAADVAEAAGQKKKKKKKQEHSKKEESSTQPCQELRGPKPWKTVLAR